MILQFCILCIEYKIAKSYWTLFRIYDRKREKLHFFDRTFHHLLFCQTPNFLNVLSKMLFCQNKANNVLSKFVKILSNSDGYLDSLLFCHTPSPGVAKIIIRVI